jgi:hypothetical protein
MGIVKSQEKRDKQSQSNIELVAHTETLTRQKQINDRNQNISFNINIEC